MGKSLEYLKERVNGVSFDETLFRISVGEDKYIFGAILSDSQKNGKPDFFAIDSIYNSIIDLNEKIQFSFHLAVKCNPSESLADHVWFGKPQENEAIATYYIENMVFRTQILWDMLAQLYNAFWCTNKPIEKIYAEKFFNVFSQGKTAKKAAKSIHSYFIQEDTIKGDCEPWDGNHKYVKEYRNQLTHRTSPNISSFSSIARELRPPAIFVLKRTTEDYLQAVEFLNNALDEISKEFSSFISALKHSDIF